MYIQLSEMLYMVKCHAMAFRKIGAPKNIYVYTFCGGSGRVWLADGSGAILGIAFGEGKGR